MPKPCTGGLAGSGGVEPVTWGIRVGPIEGLAVIRLTCLADNGCARGDLNPHTLAGAGT